MDSRYWKEFENMGDMDNDKRSDSGSDRVSSHYRKESSDRRRRSKSHSRSRSRSLSGSRSHSSSSSSSSSSRSSSSSSRHHSDYRSRRSSSKSKREKVYSRKSPTRGGNNYNNKREEERNGSGWFPPSHPNYPAQGQDLPPPASASYIPPPPPPQYPSAVQGSYPPNNFQGPQNFGNNYHGGYPGYESAGNYYPPNPPNFQPPPHEYGIGGPNNRPQTSNWEMFPDTTQPPPLIGGPGPAGGPISGESHPGLSDIKSEEAKKEAIEQELIQQRRTLSKQREDYVKRKFSLNRELNRLKNQKRELLKENSKDNERILRENAKLQSEILQKLKSIDNVIEMLSGIIGDSARLPDVIKEIKSLEKSEKKKTEKRKRDKSEDKHGSDSAEEEHRERERGKEHDRSRDAEHEDREESRQKDENRVYYDPGIHWCSECNVFPKTISEYLDHLHSADHKKNTKLKFEEFPWHAGQNLEEKMPSLNKDHHPPKRIPIRGVQFLVPATAWFCSMCKVWLGDLHCANKHIQNQQHSNNYHEFIMKNQHWEVDWLTERTRSYERNSEAKHQPGSSLLPQQTLPSPSPLTIASLSDQLLAMIAANSKLQEPPPPPPPPPITKSSSSSDDESPDRKSKKKRKKSKKSKKNKDGKSPSKESDQIKLNYKAMIERKPVESLPADDSFINEWMPKVDKRGPVQIKPKSKNEVSDSVRSAKSMRRSSVGSQESPGLVSDKAISPYEHPYNDHDEAVIFDKRPTHMTSLSSYEQKEQISRNKRKEEELIRHDRQSKYERSPKEKSKYEDKYGKYNKYDDHKSKKDIKSYTSERDKRKKSPISRLRELREKEAERKKGRKFVGPNKNDEEDVHETSFEKRTSESAAKKKDGKKPVVNSLPKTKLPFIGRMPILKKKVEQKMEEKDEKKDVEDSASKDSIPELALLQETIMMETEAPDMQPSVEELPKSTLIISKRPRLAEPGIVKKEILFNKPANDNLTEQDMELDDDSAALAKEEESAKDELHKDFKDALDLLFPEEKKSDSNEDADVIKQEAEATLEEQQSIVASAAPTAYMVPTGYDMSMYQTYYDPAYVQQWAQMGYDQTGQYAGAYAYPPPTTLEGVPQPTMEVMVNPSETPAVSEPKKKKNPLSQRMRRHLQKKKAKEAAEKVEGRDDKEGGEEEGDVDEEDYGELEDEEPEEENESVAKDGQKPEDFNKMGHISDLALLGIDEDDAAAQGFY